MHQRQFKTSRIFDTILKEKPDSFVWLGDFAYLDDLKVVDGKRKFMFIDPDAALKRYQQSYDDPYYTKVRQSTKIYGIWDDHDSGINDSDKTNFRKEMYRQMFLDYIDEPKDSKRRSRKGGMYESYFLDSEKLIKLVLLDVRYDRDSVSDDSIPFEEKSLLGKEQEEWLKQEVLNSKAQFTLIGIGNQLFPDDRPMLEIIFPRTREMLRTLYNPNTVQILLTGDVHYGEALVDHCAKYIHGYPLHEFTTSGLSHSVADLSKLYHGIHIDTILSFIFPDTYSKPEDRYAGLNYATLDFDLDPLDPEKSTIDFRLKDLEGNTVVRRYMIRGTDLQSVDKPDMDAYLQCRDARGSAKMRKYLNMASKLLDPTRALLYLFLGALVVMFLILWLAARCVSTVSKLRKTIVTAYKQKQE